MKTRKLSELRECIAHDTQGMHPSVITNRGRVVAYLIPKAYLETSGNSELTNAIKKLETSNAQ